MALEAGQERFSASPTSSGRATPVPSRLGGRHIENDTPPKDKAYRRYAAGVERALALFETAFEDWADYISFLGRLLKALQAHPPKVQTIPSKIIVAKRLAQCLNPELPGGVHQKALEVYNFIFTLIQHNNLSNDLALYLPGLSSTLSFASLSVRTPFLALLETHLLKVNPEALRPALKSIVLMLLPGLEEETSEDFDRTLGILNSFKSAVKAGTEGEYSSNQETGDEYFWQCFFLASITSNNRRLGSLAYLIRYLPKLGGSTVHNDHNSAPKNALDSSSTEGGEENDASMVTSPEPGLLVRCFAAGLQDEQILIQRGFLDLLVSHLPLHAKVLQTKLKPDDLELLVIAASGVVTRRDMSLNRRLWSWMLGPETNTAAEIDESESPVAVAVGNTTSSDASRTRYFEEFGLQPLVRALLKMIAADRQAPAQRAKPYRICLSLMDRWEIGGLVVPEIFLAVVSSVQRYKASMANTEEFQEVLRSASVFFDGVESGLIWGDILGLLAESLGPNELNYEERREKLDLVRFILTNFNIQEEEMLVIHAPHTALAVLAMLSKCHNIARSTEPSDGDRQGDILNLATNIAADLIDLIPERAFRHHATLNQASKQDLTTTGDGHEAILRGIRKFYVNDQGNLDVAEAPFSAAKLAQLMLGEATRLTSESLQDTSSSADVAVKTRILVALLVKTPKGTAQHLEGLFVQMNSVLERTSRPPFSTFKSIISLLVTSYEQSYSTVEQASGLIASLVSTAWSFLTPAYPKYHVETVKLLSQVQASLPPDNQDIEAAICTEMIKNNKFGNIVRGDADPARRFAILWTHMVSDSPSPFDRRASFTDGNDKASTTRTRMATYQKILIRPLFLLLDGLQDEHTPLFATTRTWLQGLTGIDKLLYIFIVKLSGFAFLKPGSLQDSDQIMTATADDDYDHCLYYLQKLSCILRWSSPRLWAAISGITIPTDANNDFLYSITGHDGDISLQEVFVHICVCAASYHSITTSPSARTELQRVSLAALHQILQSSQSAALAKLQLEERLVALLHASLDGAEPAIQVSLLDVVLAAVRINAAEQQQLQSPRTHSRFSSMDMTMGMRTLQRQASLTVASIPPSSLIKCLQAGFESPSTRPVLDSWVNFLAEILPFYVDSIFQLLIPLVGTLCSQVTETFELLSTTFQGQDDSMSSTPEATLIALINGLEQVLARSHERLRMDESKVQNVKSPDQPQGFFSNITPSFLTADAPQTRSQTANNRLTVLLSIQNAVRISYRIWSWGTGQGALQDPESSASFSYTSLRMRNRARRLLEHLFAAEALECLETVVEIWQNSQSSQGKVDTAVFSLMHVLDGSRPKYTIPAIFDALYSRTNPTALDPSRKSTLTSDLQDTDLVMFLVEYARSLEDDAMDEIWVDCMTFLKDILTNPFPHRQILPGLLEFGAILGEKVDNTNFGEQKKMRRELGDLFLRLLTATFTTKPISFSEKSNDLSSLDSDLDKSSPTVEESRANKANDIVTILASVTPKFTMVLVEPERVLAAANTISASVIGPTFKSKSFPENVSASLLDLIFQVARLPGTQKAWRKDVSDAFNDSKFFSHSTQLFEHNWLPLLRQWTVGDKERMPELLSRLTPPTTAGIVFGVGATSARMEADRKTQLNLRRIATLILATPDDTYVTEIGPLEAKFEDLLAATPTSSPSSATRAEIFIVMRALALKTAPVHLASLWPTINAELHIAIAAVIAPDHSQTSDTYNNYALLQACKLLDTLLCIAPDDFQLFEWLYITDTIDAVYRPSNHRPVSLVDDLVDELGSLPTSSATYQESNSHFSTNSSKAMRRPLLGKGGIDGARINLDRKDELVGKVLRPFFSQLSIFAFERTYEMGQVEGESLKKDIIQDLCDERGVVRAL